MAVLAGVLFAGAPFSGARTVFSTITLRAGGTGGEACSPLLPPMMYPRKNPTSSPRSSPTASVIRNALAGPGLLLLFAVLMTLLLSMVLFPRSSRTYTLGLPLGATQSR